LFSLDSEQAKHLQCCLAIFYRNESYYTFPQHVMALNYWRIINQIHATSEPYFTNVSYITWVWKKWVFNFRTYIFSANDYRVWYCAIQQCLEQF